MTITEELSASQQHQHFVHEEQMDLLNKIREVETTMGALFESAILCTERREEFLEYVDQQRRHLWSLEAQIDPLYRSVVDSMGSIGEWSEITPQSYVSDDMDIEGPEITTNTRNYLMTERLHLDRRTRTEMYDNRTKPDDEGSEAPDSYDGTIYDQIYKSAYDLKVYPCTLENKEVRFFENIRIMTLRNGSPFVVERDEETGEPWFRAPQEYMSYMRPILGVVSWKSVMEKVYIPIKIGHKTVQRRMIWHRSSELKELYYMDERTPAQEARYRYLLNKYDKMNMVERRKPVYYKNGKPNIIGHTQRTMLMSGGLNFNRSCQLAPEDGFEYSNNPRFSYKQDWAYTIKNAFMQRVDRGDVRECTHVTDNGKHEPRTYKRQVYAVMRVVFEGYEAHVVVFSDVR